MSARTASPWYVETFLAIGGWVAGLLAAIAIFSMSFAMVGGLGGEAADIMVALSALVIGAGFVLAGAAFGEDGEGDFRRHFTIAAIAAGLTAATIGGWYALYKLVSVATSKDDIAAGLAGLAAAIGLAAASWRLARRLADAILAFLTTLAVYGVTFGSLAALTHELAAAPDHLLPPLCAFAGAALFLTARNALVRSAAAALMLAPMAHFAILENLSLMGADARFNPVIHAIDKAALLAAALYCLSLMRAKARLIPLGATALLAIAGVWLLPTAGGVAIVILFAGVAAGHRGLAIIGVVACAWFLGRFYYDLSMTLLEKSAILAAMGAATLIGALAWRRLSRAAPAAPGPAAARRSLVAILGVGALLGASLFLVNRSVTQLEADFRAASEILLPLGPRDPRSILQGDYMTLAYDARLFPAPDLIETAPRDGEAFLRLDDNRVATFSRFAGAGDVPAADEIRVDFVKTRDGRMRYAPDSFFFQEGEADIYQPARFAIIRVAPDGKTRLAGLADENRVRLGQ